MRLKILGFLCFAASVGFLAFSLVHAQTAATQKPSVAAGNLPGRYQLTTATIDHVVPDTQHVVLRIDSQTGQVWLLQTHIVGSANYPTLFWDPIPEGDTKPN